MLSRGAQWARIQKNVQKPPQSTLMILKSEWPPHSTSYFSKIHFLSPPHSTYSCPNLWFIEWSVEVLFFWKENDKTLAKQTPNELWCFPPKELIPFSGENTSLKENLYEILPNFGLFNTFLGDCGGVEIFTWSHILWQFFELCERTVDEFIFKFLFMIRYIYK